MRPRAVVRLVHLWAGLALSLLLMAGEGGERVGGVAALLGAFMVVTGLVLWWPARCRLRPSRGR